ncbi:ArsR family transcriptional regulator [Aerococcaceae bacterium zg-ZJ1578]|uniref:ArsR/SmtB family transcription factor n=1 Tax=Aerococcaceae bacterium zg-252 TaxID=2796928 RepID=UPI001A1D0A5C|nr:ArsR family transcriptional regulator [Aerococcaceae bacterium zg-1578]MBR7927514.1 ArsR family transcriptional regulator [Aerococcaceae bacterium zg-ZUI334]
MDLTLTQESINTIKALANDTRISIINLLQHQDLNISEIANALMISTSITTRHIKSLEDAGIINTYIKPHSIGQQKICHLKIDEINIRFPMKKHLEYQKKVIDIPVGSFTKYHATPTCGMASEQDYIGILDEPRYFMIPERTQAQLLWFSSGYVEYSFFNPIPENGKIHLIEISFEIASEFPENNYVWPSDITFHLNGSRIGEWTVPGNFADVRGKLTPEWWPTNNSQYGLLKHLRITPVETHIDGEKISNFNLSNINISENFYKIRFSVLESSKHVGGLTLFGEKFGNTPQNIRVTIYYNE